MARLSDSVTRYFLILLLLIPGLLGAALYSSPVEPESPAYREGREALDKRDWRAAESAFERAIAEDEEPDAAYYWLAYAKSKRGQTADALETLARLQRDWPRSEWRDDAEALRVELLRSGGQEPDEEQIGDEEIKLMALAGLAMSDPDRAMPMVEKILRGNGSEDLKEQALFVAGQMGGSAGAEMLMRIARDNSQGELQESAIEYLAVVGGSEQLPMLEDLYQSGVSRSAKEAILSAFMIAGDTERLLALARTEPDTELRSDAIHLLGTQDAGEELWALYQTETSTEVREAILEALMISGDSAHLRAVARDANSSDELREMAIQLLGVQGDHEVLLEIFDVANSIDLKSTIVQALGIAGRGEDLLVVVQDRSQPLEIREEAVVALGIHGGDEALWQLLQEGEEDLAEEIMMGLGLAGRGDRLLEVVGDSSRPLEVREQAMESMMMVGPESEQLEELYSTLQERELKEAVLEVMFASGAAEALVTIVKTEKDRGLRAKAVEYLGLTGSPMAADVLEAILEE